MTTRTTQRLTAAAVSALVAATLVLIQKGIG